MTALLFLVATIRDTFPDTWVATDQLGRAVQNPADPAPRPDKKVGVFYFIANRVPGAPIYDNTVLLNQNPQSPAYGPMMSTHWWGRPWFGYYQSDDPFVIRKHMQMLADAGVDFIVFDNTNGPTYPDVYLNLCKVLEQMKADGDPYPRIAFFTGHGAWNTLNRDFYSKNLYSDLWFRWLGKPLMMIHREGGDVIPPEIQSTFTVRESWAWTPSAWFGDGKDKWPWLDNYPQNFGWHNSKTVPEQVSVTVGQHATSSIGRSSLAQHEPPLDDRRLSPQTPLGLCFNQQFQRALQIDPQVLFITGWNEWTATRFPQEGPGTFAGRPAKKGDGFFVDEFNEEFSRDIEPEDGRLQDNYYMQLCGLVRRYKGVRAVPPATHKSIRTEGGFDQWNDVGPEYRDDVGDVVHRDWPGWANLHYKDDSGRNDIVAAKVASDDRSLYFYVRCHNAIVGRGQPDWMRLYLNVDGDAGTGWFGYDYAVNRIPGQATTSVERYVGKGPAWTSVGYATIRVEGNQMMLSVPRSLLAGHSHPPTIDFKWTDNIPETNSVSAFTLYGDAAPNDRFSYRAKLR